MAGIFLLALLSIVGSSSTTDGYCDMVEVNHYIPEGRHHSIASSIGRIGST